MPGTLRLAILFFLLAPIAAAQTLFRASLDGSQEVPPINTTATGWATFTLTPNHTLQYFVDSQGLVGTGAHIHEGVRGQGGPIIFVLTGGPDIYSGTTAVLTAAQESTLRASGYYVNIHTNDHLNGDIRGQMEPSPLSYGAHLIGGEVVPPVSSSAVGEATLQVSLDRSIAYQLTTSGLTGTEAHIHTGPVGQDGPILFSLAGGPAVWSGTTPPMTTTDFNRLQALDLYVDVHTAARPGGEIRAQLVRGAAPYGLGLAGTIGIPVLAGSGALVPDGVLTLAIAGGKPLSQGLMLASLTASCERVSGCGYYLGPLAFTIRLPLDGSGALGVSTVLPDLAPFDLYLQYFNLDPGSKNGQFATTNGLHVPFTNY
jgi:hypothetical protein